ncbi:hypothetical protein KAX08_09270 [candidate division WOR-3 bacterium]|nr:hypothetical protein [candidate division WOR-3 bacterium]
METQVIIANNLGYISCIDDLLTELEALRRMTLNFIKYLKNKK